MTISFKDHNKILRYGFVLRYANFQSGTLFLPDLFNLQSKLNETRGIQSQDKSTEYWPN